MTDSLFVLRITLDFEAEEGTAKVWPLREQDAKREKRLLKYHLTYICILAVRLLRSGESIPSPTRCLRELTGHLPRYFTIKFVYIYHTNI